MQNSDLTQDIIYVLMQTARTYWKALDCELAQRGVTCRQAQVLVWLHRKGDLSPCQLADLLLIEPATLTGVLERMERAGLILRLAHPLDGRRKVIRLARGAESLCDTVVECLMRVRTRAVSDIPPEELDVLYELLGRMLNNLILR